MRRPTTTALALLLAFSAPALPAAESPSSPQWKKLSETGGQLAFLRNVIDFGLTCPVSELPVAFAQAADLRPEHRGTARVILLTAWVRRDTPAARKARQIAETSETPWAEYEVTRYFQTLAGISADAALGEIDALPASPAKSRYLFFTLTTLSELDPRRTTEEIRTRLSAAGEDAPWLLGIWGESAPEEALAALSAISDDEQQNAAKRHLLQSWFTRAPEQALRWILANEDPAHRDELITQLANSLGFGDWDALRRLTDATSDPAVRALLEAAAAETMPYQGPTKLWTQIQTKGWAGVPEHELNSLFEYAATRPPEEAAAFYRGVPASLINSEHSADLLSEAWTLVDPDAALAWARAIPDGRLRDYSLLHINSMLTELGPDLAIAQIEQTPPGKLRNRMMRNTALGLAKTDLPFATEWTFSLPPGEARDQAIEGLAIAAARNQGAAFALEIEKLPAGPARARLTGVFTERWLQEDAAAASAWVLAMPDGPERKAAFAPALRTLASQLPDDAFALLPTLASPNDRFALIQALGDYQAVAHTEKVLAAIDTLTDQNRKRSVLSNTLSQLAKDDPLTIAELVAEGAFGAAGSVVVSNTLTQWTGSTADAAAWVNRLFADDALTIPNERSRIASSVAEWMVNSDPAGALNWVSSLPEGQIREHAAGGLVRQLANHRPVEGFKLAVRFNVPDPALKQTVETLSRLAPAQAESLVRDSALPENRKTKALAWLLP